MKYLTVVAIILMLGFGACGGSSLVGKWAADFEEHGDRGLIELEFFKDGEFKSSITAYNRNDSHDQDHGTWRDLGNGKLMLIHGRSGKEETFSYEIKINGRALQISVFPGILFTKQ